MRILADQSNDWKMFITPNRIHLKCRLRKIDFYPDYISNKKYYDVLYMCVCHEK